MEALKGGDLQKYMSKRNKSGDYLTEREVRIIMRQILEAVKYMHVQGGIMHRDLKPENILLKDCSSDHICVKIADFGLACQKNSHDLMGRHTLSVGTKLYMAPEMFFEKNYTQKVDMWAIGCIMFNLLFQGERPFYNSGEGVNKFVERLGKEKLHFD